MLYVASMPVPTPFHPRTAALCQSLRWKEWAGYAAVCSYETGLDLEYFGLRHTAGLLDVTPLYKYEVTGPDARAFLTRLMCRNVGKLRPGRVAYTCWVDEAGKIVDDGTVTRLDEQHYRVTAADPSLVWLERYARGFDVTIEDSSRRIAALAVQGPSSGGVVAAATDGVSEGLGFFRARAARIGSAQVLISRTGYTGDLGFEIWCAADDALGVWDAVVAAGRPYALRPVGLDALDITRVEAGFILNGVDYFSARHCTVEARKSTPFELGLDWLVHLDRDPFVGQAALQAEQARGPAVRLAGLILCWEELEAMWDAHGLPPELPAGAWRTTIPIYSPGGRRQVGYATSGAWSPILKQNLALAHLEPALAETGATVLAEVTVERERRTVTAQVVERPFFDPARKRA